MKYAIICSEKDPAGMGVHKVLVDYFGFEKTSSDYGGAAVYGLGNARLYTTKKDSVECDDIDKEIDAGIFIFATRHSGGAGIPSLSAHSPGNWGKADFGGKPGQISTAPAGYLKHAIKKLEELNNLGFDVMQEATHHGPRISKPCMFIEIGSTEKEWERKDAAEIIAKVVVSLVTDEISDIKSTVGIGGPHYCPGFKKIMLNSDVGVGHVCAKYALEDIDEEMLNQAIEKTLPKTSMIILDWKGLGEHKQKIKSLIEPFDIDVKRTSDF